MGEHTMTPADVGAVLNGRNDGGGWFGGEMIFGLIFLAAMLNGGWGGFGGFGGRGGGDCLTTAESCNMNSFNEMKSQVGRMNDMMFTNARQTDNAIATLGFQGEQNANATQRAIENCCCELKTAVHAEGEATRNMMQQSKIDALQEKVGTLEMQSMLCGVPRIPTSFTYAVNPGALFNGGCCGNNRGCGNTLF